LGIAAEAAPASVVGIAFAAITAPGLDIEDRIVVNTVTCIIYRVDDRRQTDRATAR
jgi:hypothetical protein